MYNCVVCPIWKLPYATFNLAPRYFEVFNLVVYLCATEFLLVHYDPAIVKTTKIFKLLLTGNNMSFYKQCRIIMCNI